MRWDNIENDDLDDDRWDRRWTGGMIESGHPWMIEGGMMLEVEIDERDR